LISALSGFRAKHPALEAQHSALPFAGVVQTTTLLVLLIRQENPAFVDRVSTRIRL
jgi:hypothetical protein